MQKEETIMAKREMKKTNTEELTIEQVNLTAEEEVDQAPEKVVIGSVFNCSKLNIRKLANIKADPITTVNVKTKLVIDESKSTKEWYKVTLDDGTQGFCMKKYVTIDN